MGSKPDIGFFYLETIMVKISWTKTDDNPKINSTKDWGRMTQVKNGCF
jgi:hypothetical protein